MKYALLNTFARSSDSAGTLVSAHRTIAAASAANTRLQRRTERANGRGSYLPTQIVRLAKRLTVGDAVCAGEYTALTDDEKQELSQIR